MAEMGVKEYPVIWVQCASCTGCSVSVLNAVSPSIKNVLIDEVIPGKHLNLRFQATIMAGAGDLVIEEMESSAEEFKGGYILVVEGAIPLKGNGKYGSLGEKDGQLVPMDVRIESLARDALSVIALGTCAAFGGIPAAKPNPSQCVGVGELLQMRRVTTPLVNVPGCPPHPDWFVGTVASIMLNGLPAPEELDEHRRPKVFYGRLIHENCPRRAYFDEGKFARKFGDPGCLHELGCKGPLAYADCFARMWNHGTNWCIANGHPCIACQEPGFPDVSSPLYQKLTGIEIPNIASERKEA